MTYLRALALCGVAVVVSCGEDLGPCDEAKAAELVYGRGGLVATAGQALTHDSCGNAAFCHSARARGDSRVGAPAGLDFDMMPKPDGWLTLHERAGEAWEAVREGTMPPRGVGDSKIGDGAWHFDYARTDDAKRLPALATAEGKEIFRNWLACQAPTVTDTMLNRPEPDAGSEDDAGTDGVSEDWSTLYADIVAPSCAVAGCHDDSSRAGGLPMGEACSARDALLQTGACGQVRVVAGDTDSFLLEKLREATPSCGSRMPLIAPLPAADIERIARWIEDGALAHGCD